MSPAGIGSMLKGLREGRHLNQVELAKKASVTTAYISMLEAGKKRNPSLAVLQRLAKALNVPTATLMEAGGVRHMKTVLTAALPTFLKIHLAEAAQGKRSYLDVGYHLGYHHPDTFDLNDGAVSAVTEEDLARPTATLRRLFASDEHPEAGLVDYIPAKRRADFLRGLIYGIQHLDRWDIEERRR
jgi:transcriptional regulator with XRE-family HTH domain